MFLDVQKNKNQKDYFENLESIAKLSNLFSESTSPYLGYRVVENTFCKSLGADNLSRSDCSADASKDKIGIGIKTFLNNNGKTLQKVAEFNKDAEKLRDKLPKEIVSIVSELRNERIKATKRIHGLDEMIYHCVVREPGKIKIFECPMDEINLKTIKNVKLKNNTITFEDDKNEYSINLSKSTLYKRFITDKVIKEISVKIIENPDEIIKNLFKNPESNNLTFVPIRKEKDYVYLPLFSDVGGRNVPERSGLNQWNAAGRPRDANEVYIPIPIWIHRKFPEFFPPRDEVFKLVLPDGQTLSTKVCQAGNKALMSNPNAALGKWILRQVMDLKENELLTYERLEELGLDSVIIYKEENGEYKIDFTQIGSYDEFYNENK
jgi:hypothetical protein